MGAWPAGRLYRGKGYGKTTDLPGLADTAHLHYGLQIKRETGETYSHLSSELSSGCVILDAEV